MWDNYKVVKTLYWLLLLYHWGLILGLEYSVRVVIAVVAKVIVVIVVAAVEVVLIVKVLATIFA